ncbi:hypothetical protein LBMAG51_07770 [Phycisphaerae bacterium]|nr:hypothetical protein LBMAG51_07770 [Phycisphaerae bacterium]
MTGNRYRRNNSVGIVEEGLVNNSVEGVVVIEFDSNSSRAGIRSSVNEAFEIGLHDQL